MMRNVCVADAKSPYDQLEREPECKGPRIGIAIGEIKQSMVAANIAARWIPHNRMVVDALTKGFGKANLQPLLELLKTGKFVIGEVETERLHLKQEGKKVRHKGARDGGEDVIEISEEDS